MNLLYIDCDMNCVHYFHAVNGFWISGNFPEIAWRAVHSRHAAHIIFAFSGFLKRNRLAVNSQPPGDACWKAQFLVLVELPGSDVYPPGDEGHIGAIYLFFWVLGKI